ncbi:type I polyketide synthase [Photobacterium gaetbulicola]|uniref:Putative McyG protein n=1 Tax=Photobacterium gaetbulicola Gung47 TaxID=658445 RepID=A0A0C5W548_9GAMM|nr:type I polyketide synthase [Photobacterium gaetbulicola]AJR06626.1 putative McyG protein [Photobacterium gaetbulicola Gung47]PSU13950.1 type I polyketide synthase [Photobacterium gaetbulicola]
MTERWSQLSVLMESYFENSSSVVLSQIENAIKLELSHREAVADVLVYANDGVVTVTLFLTSMDINVEREIYAGWMKQFPALQDKIAIQMVNLIDDAICKGDAISTPECSPKTVAEAFLRTAENFPEKTLTFHEANGDEKNITYRQLHQDATKVSMHLVNREESSAKTVVLVAGELSVYITAFWGCVLAGRSSLTVMLAPDYHGDDIHQNKLGQAISVLEPEFVLCCDEGAKRIGEAVEILAGAELLNVSEQLRFTTQHILAPAPIEAVCPLFYQLTSGSTGEAKVIPITETAVLDQIYAVNQFCGYHGNHVSLNWLPFDHVIALLAAHIHDVYLGRQQVHLATPLVLADPLYWLRQLEHYRVSHCFAPNFAFRLVLEQLACTPEHGVSDLSQLEQIVSGGEAVSGKTVTRFIRQFESTGLRPNVIQPSYGMAEAAAGVTFERAWSPAESVMELQASDRGGELRTHVTSLGRILPGLSMRVVGKNQQLLKEREIGEIQLLGRKMCHEGNGWFGTGDLGFIDRQRLFVTGRLKDVIIVNGANFCSHQLESVVASVEGIRCGHVAVVGDRRQSEESVAVFYVPDDEENVEHNDSYYLSQIAAIKGTLAKATGLAASAVLPLTEQQFPRTSIGKIKRVALQESLQADDYTARLKAIDGQLSARMASGRRPARASELAIRLRNIWASVLNIDDLDESANFFELGGNSVLSAQLIGQINRQFDLNLDVIALFEAPSLKLMQELVSGGLSIKQDKDTSSNTSSSKVASVVAGRETMRKDIAIIGMAGVFPGAANVDEFWQKLVDGQELMRGFTEQELSEAGLDPSLYRHEDYVARGGAVEGSNEFDAAFFGYSLKDAELMDPQSRLLHQQCWHAMESAGYVPSASADTIGLYLGASSSCNMDWMSRAADVVSGRELSDTMTLHTLADRDFIATRIAYAIGLTGPAVTVQTACSTGLVATHMAVQALREGNCNIALAGAASVRPVKQGYRRQNGMMLSQSGMCRPFDAEADGTIFTDGVGVVVLKLLDNALRDGDNIIAVIKGTAVNNDGHRKAGYLAPGVQGQEEVIRRAQEDAQVTPHSIGYVEAHGTATQLGDPIEVRALANIFSGRKTPPCRLGSVKSNIGHAEAAAGMAGLIKSALAVRYRQVPASLNYRTPNPQIDFASAGLEVNHTLWDWQGAPSPYRAGISSFGIGGTNAHMVVEEPPKVQETDEDDVNWAVIPVSAKTTAALAANMRQLAAFLGKGTQPSLRDLAHTLAVGRTHLACRQAIVCQTPDSARLLLEQQVDLILPEQKKSLFLMFPGQGAQFPGMLAELLAVHSPYREVAEQCLALLPDSVRADLTAIIRGELSGVEKLNDTRLVQPALFIVQYSLARVVLEWGVVPEGMIGHSLGEYVAATLSGVMTLGDALNLVVVRGRLMSQAAAGRMLGVSLTEAQVERYLSDTVNLAAVNGPNQCVLSGSRESIDELTVQLNCDGILFNRLPVSHAYHSYMMDSILEEFAAEVAAIPMSHPEKPYISTLTGDWMVDEVLEPTYWVKHLRQTVCFNKGIELAMVEPDRVFIDMGPGKTLGSLIRQHPGLQSSHTVISLTRHKQEMTSDIDPLFTAAASLYENGFDIDWARFNPVPNARRIALPLYPFEKQTFELVIKGEENYQSQEHEMLDGNAQKAFGKRPRPVLGVPYRAPETADEKAVADFWSDELGVIQPGLDDEFFELGGDSLVILRLVNRINEYFGTGLTVATLMDARTIAEQAILAGVVSATQTNDSDDFEMDLGELL